MAITVIVNGVKTAVAIAAATDIPATKDTLVTADGFGVGEVAQVFRLGPSTSYHAYMNESGPVVLSAIPNTVKLPAPGVYRIVKPVTVANAYLGYEVLA